MTIIFRSKNVLNLNIVVWVFGIKSEKNFCKIISEFDEFRFFVKHFKAIRSLSGF